MGQTETHSLVSGFKKITPEQVRQLVLRPAEQVVQVESHSVQIWLVELL